MLPATLLLPMPMHDANARASTDRDEKSFVGDGSIETYVRQLVRFDTYLFDNHKEKLSDEHLEKMTDAYNEDQLRNDRKGTALRNYIAHAVDALKPLHDGQHHNSFLKLDGDEALDYDTVVDGVYDY